MIRRPPRSTLFPYTPLSQSEGTRIRRGVSRITTVPLPNERIGDFSAAAGSRAGVSYPTLYDFTNGQPFANNQIPANRLDRKSTRLNSSHLVISYAVFCLKKK